MAKIRTGEGCNSLFSTPIVTNYELEMDLELPEQWNQIKQKLLRYPGIYTHPGKLVEMLEFCAQSPVLKNLTIQLSLSRLLFCRYAGDTDYPCAFATDYMYVVSNFRAEVGTFFIELKDVLVFLEVSVLALNKQSALSTSG